jgi:predicted GNAT superfamily acetyltransferase
VAESDGAVQGFLLVLQEGARYDSPNYLWFSQHFPHFLYIDRVVVAGSAQGLGVGRLLYEDLFRFANLRGPGMIACEFDVDPPNLASQRFHERFGFKEVGTQRVGASRKLVSLQAVAV